MLSSSAAVRRQLYEFEHLPALYFRDSLNMYELEHGICQICKVDAGLQFRTVKSLPVGEERLQFLMGTEHRLRGRLDKMLADPKEGDFWQASEKVVVTIRCNASPNAQADHIRPVKEGGAAQQQRASCCALCNWQAAKQTSQTFARYARRATSLKQRL